MAKKRKAAKKQHKRRKAPMCKNGRCASGKSKASKVRKLIRLTKARKKKRI